MVPSNGAALVSNPQRRPCSPATRQPVTRPGGTGKTRTSDEMIAEITRRTTLAVACRQRVHGASRYGGDGGALPLVCAAFAHRRRAFQGRVSLERAGRLRAATFSGFPTPLAQTHGRAESPASRQGQRCWMDWTRMSSRRTPPTQEPASRLLLPGDCARSRWVLHHLGFRHAGAGGGYRLGFLAGDHNDLARNAAAGILKRSTPLNCCHRQRH